MRIRSLVIATAVLVAGLGIPATAAHADTTVTGHVYGPGGTPLAGIAVEWFDPLTHTSGTPTATAGDGSYSTTVTASVPSYYIAVNLQTDLVSRANGTYPGQFVGAGFATSYAFQKMGPLTQVSVGSADVTLATPGSATVANAAFTGATLQLQNLRGDYLSQATADAAGSVTFANLVPGRYRVTAIAGLNYAVAPWTSPPFTVFASATTAVPVTLKTAAVIIGTVRSHGRPVKGVSVSAFADHSDVFSTTKTLADGSYVLGNLTTDTYSFFVSDFSGSKYAYASYYRNKVKATQGAFTKISPSIARSGVVVVSVATRKGTALQVALHSKAFTTVQSVKAKGSTARVTFPYMPADRYTATAVSPRGQRFGAVTVTSVSGKTSRSHTAHLTRRTVSLTGSIAHGSSGTVVVTNSALFTEAKASLSHGRFVVRGIVPGTSGVVTTAKGYYPVTHRAKLTRSVHAKAYSRGSKLATLKGRYVLPYSTSQSFSYVASYTGRTQDFFYITDSAGRFSGHPKPGTYTIQPSLNAGGGYGFQQGSPFYFDAPTQKVKITAGHTTDLGTRTAAVRGG